MTKDEALKLALDTLESSRVFVTTCEKIKHPEGTEWYEECITAIREALAQPEQEPVAWRNAAIRVGEDLCSVGPFGYYDMTAQQWLDWALSVVTVHAPPPHRKPLTDEQWQVIADTLDCLITRKQKDAIEAVIGIKREA